VVWPEFVVFRGVRRGLSRGVVPPFLNGLAVFANKHALSLAHASRCGKCKIGVPLVVRQGRSPSGGLVSLHQREAQRLLWQLFFGRTLRAGIGAQRPLSGGIRGRWPTFRY